ncbi:hypothetical protein Pfo_024660 [Paulownia fortunei]|nr:hypothetical protein Pfo_024660 [Paulownia fortunei]
MSSAAQSFKGNRSSLPFLLLIKALAGLRRINLEGLKWRVFDARRQVLGRLALHISTVVQGKDKPTYTPNRDEGDMCVVINAKYVCDPTEVIRKAVLHLLPRNKLRDDSDRKLRIFSGSDHPFAMIRAQTKAEQQEQDTTNTRKGKKKENIEAELGA